MRVASGASPCIRALIGEDDTHLDSFVQRDQISEGLYAGATRQNTLPTAGIMYDIGSGVNRAVTTVILGV
jgi:hypothetical protein